MADLITRCRVLDNSMTYEQQQATIALLKANGWAAPPIDPIAYIQAAEIIISTPPQEVSDE